MGSGVHNRWSADVVSACYEEQRSRASFRIGARHRRSSEAVADREAELVSGYAELDFAGFLTVSAPTPRPSTPARAAIEGADAAAGLDLGALDGRAHRGLLPELPIGRGLASRAVL